MEVLGTIVVLTAVLLLFSPWLLISIVVGGARLFGNIWNRVTGH